MKLHEVASKMYRLRMENISDPACEQEKETKLDIAKAIVESLKNFNIDDKAPKAKLVASQKEFVEHVAKEAEKLLSNIPERRVKFTQISGKWSALYNITVIVEKGDEKEETTGQLLYQDQDLSEQSFEARMIRSKKWKYSQAGQLFLILNDEKQLVARVSPNRAENIGIGSRSYIDDDNKLHLRVVESKKKTDEEPLESQGNLPI